MLREKMVILQEKQAMLREKEVMRPEKALMLRIFRDRRRRACPGYRDGLEQG